MNKVKFGLRNVVYAKMTYNEEEREYTYATPVSIPGAVNLSLSPSGDSNDFYADDIIYFADSNNNGYEGDLEIAIIPDSFKKDILGETEDANKVLFENAEDKTNPFALGFEIQGDQSGRRTWLYNCVATRPNQNGATKETSKTPSTDTLTIKAMPHPDNKYVKAVITNSETTKAAYDSFFTEVYEKSDVPTA